MEDSVQVTAAETSVLELKQQIQKALLKWILKVINSGEEFPGHMTMLVNAYRNFMETPGGVQ